MKRKLIALLIASVSALNSQAADLMTVYQQALENDPLTQQAKARKQAALNGIDQSRAALLPQLSLSLSASKINGDQAQETNSASLNLSQSIYNAANWAGLDRAELLAEQADAGYGLALQNLILRSVSAYFEALQAQDDLAFAQAEKRAIERQLEQTKQRFKVGLTAITDVHEAQALYDNALASEISAQNDVEISLEVLREITGRYYQHLAPLDKQRFSASRPSPDRVAGWLTMAEAHNLKLLAAKLGVDIADEEIDIATAGHLPSVSLNGGLSSSDIDMGTGGRSNSSSIGLSVKVPIYAGGGIEAGAEGARNQFIVASEERERVYRQVVREVRTNFYDVVAAIARLKALRQAEISAQSALKATEAGFEVGTRTIVDVLQSTRNLYNAKRNLSRAQYGYIISMLSLKLAAGSLNEVDVVAINAGLNKAD